MGDRISEDLLEARVMTVDVLLLPARFLHVLQLGPQTVHVILLLVLFHLLPHTEDLEKENN